MVAQFRGFRGRDSEARSPMTKKQKLELMWIGKEHRHRGRRLSSELLPQRPEFAAVRAL